MKNKLRLGFNQSRTYLHNAKFHQNLRQQHEQLVVIIPIPFIGILNHGTFINLETKHLESILTRFISKWALQPYLWIRCHNASKIDHLFSCLMKTSADSNFFSVSSRPIGPLTVVKRVSRWSESNFSKSLTLSSGIFRKGTHSLCVNSTHLLSHIQLTFFVSGKTEHGLPK